MAKRKSPPKPSPGEPDGRKRPSRRKPRPTEEQVAEPQPQTPPGRAAPVTYSAAASGPPPSSSPESDPRRQPFTPEVMDKTVIAIPLLEKLRAESKARAESPAAAPILYDVIIDVNLEFHEGRQIARERIQHLVDRVVRDLRGDDSPQGINKNKSKLSQQYLFAKLDGDVLQELVRRDREGQGAQESASPPRRPVRSAHASGTTPPAPTAHRAIYHIWPDFPIERFTNRSISTVKADAARNSFAALGEGIVWAVMDSGVDGSHPHFQKHKNLKLDSPLDHRDFSVAKGDGEPLVDVLGHGTHVAGIIAGELDATPEEKKSEVLKSKTVSIVEIKATVKSRDEQGEIHEDTFPLPSISGM